MEMTLHNLQAEQELVAHLAQRLHVDVCSFYRVEHAPAAGASVRDEIDDDRELVLEATCGLNQSAVGYRIPIQRGLVGRVARTGKVVALQNPERHPDFHYVDGSGEERCHTFMGIPVRDGDGQVNGVLVVQTTSPHQFEMHEVSLMHAAGRRLDELIRKAA